MEPQQIPPPWLDELRIALGVASRAVKNEGRSPEWVKSAIQAARNAGWNGDDEEFWRVAGMMADLEGSLPQHPLRAYLDRETARFWGAEATRG